MFNLNYILEPGERLLLSITPWKSAGSRAAAFFHVIFWVVLGVLPELLYFRRLDPWMVAVTDRRVLVRRRLFSKQFAEMRLSEIRQIDHDWKTDRLILTGLGNTLEILCNERQANAILAALKGAYQPPKTFWQRLRGF